MNSIAGGIGTRIDYGRDLDGDTSADAVRLRGYYRFNDRHRLAFGTTNIRRSGDKSLAIQIEFGDEVFERGDRVTSSIDMTLYKVAYAYSFYHTSKVELSVTGGLNVMRYAIELDSETDGDHDEGDVNAPLPVWGVGTRYWITPRWETHFNLETFYISIDETLRGSLLEMALGTEYRLFRNVGIGVGISQLALDAKVDADNYKGRVSENYRGATLFLSARF